MCIRDRVIATASAVMSRRIISQTWRRESLLTCRNSGRVLLAISSASFACRAALDVYKRQIDRLFGVPGDYNLQFLDRVIAHLSLIHIY